MNKFMIALFIYLSIGMLGMMWMTNDEEVKEKLEDEEDRGYLIIAIGVLLWPIWVFQTFGDEE